METALGNPTSKLEKTRAFLSRVKTVFLNHSFRPHGWFNGGHAQTLAAYAWPRAYRFRSVRDEERLFDTAPDVKVLGHCRWQPNRAEHPTMILWHGIEGSSASTYMFGTAEKAFAAGFNVIRMNLRTCGGTDHLTSSIYHGGLTDDLREVVRQLIHDDRLERLFLVGFSLGGNMVLKLAGEYAGDVPDEVVAIAAISPSVDLNASAEMIVKRSNWLYHRDFVYRLKKRMRTKHKLFPDRYDISELGAVRTLRQFDNQFTARAHGFAGAEDYYHRASSIRVIEHIQVPTLIIHAQDDPFIPYEPLLDPAVTDNPYILLIGPERGGHVAFLSESAGEDIDIFWAENRLVEFATLAHQAIS
ncbi:MAG TPA: alpha/beta fold hydrolase [Pyrinomonadaceae bacterium]|nr:alpha/beta fold hydrolase [Pyrinomonadaceae bacterium]